jgi:primosomal protein N' (replication factor Y)
LEAEINARFPDDPCLRMDSDSMKKAGAHEAAMAKFRTGEVKILLGTQMIAKGLDFPQVTLVGVINADTALHFPDFRASERTFQLVTQVAGRTGRGARGGRVLVQTFSPEHPAIQAAAQHDYRRFANEELPARREFGYPPWTGMIRIVVRGSDEQASERFAEQLTDDVKKTIAAWSVKARTLGPAPAPMAKLRGQFRFQMLLFSAEFKQLHAAVREATDGKKGPDGVQWIVDVDPSDML